MEGLPTTNINILSSTAPVLRVIVITSKFYYFYAKNEIVRMGLYFYVLDLVRVIYNCRAAGLELFAG